jgi:hypothetical protein
MGNTNGVPRENHDPGGHYAPFLDNLDAKMDGIQQFLKTQVSEGARFSRYHPFFEQSFYLPPQKAETEPLNIIEEKEMEKE